MERYGLIGEKLGHSFSKIIHEKLADYTYELIPLTPEEVEPFIKKRDFCALNVTIPYKEMVMPMLDVIDEKANAIGAVNTIVNKNGKLFGYNTDYFGFRCQLIDHNIDVKNKKVLVLGKGGASKAVLAVLRDLGAAEIQIVYYKSAEGTITYEECYKNHTDANIIVNTTPVGMYPNCDASPIDLSPFTNLEAVADVIYNPLRTKMVLDAQKRGIIGVGGLEMLVGQAKYAVEIFLNTKLDESVIKNETHQLICERSNIVLVGMSGCGKTTIGKALSLALSKKFVDTDALIVEKIGMPISDFFKQYGEEAFRKIESEVIASISGENGLIISTGGGAVLNPKNVELLKMNGRIVWIERDLHLLQSGNGRPLAPDAEATAKLYAARLPIYESVSEQKIRNQGSISDAVEQIAKLFSK